MTVVARCTSCDLGWYVYNSRISPRLKCQVSVLVAACFGDADKGRSCVVQAAGVCKLDAIKEGSQPGVVVRNEGRLQID
jgi:hypothetical protein